MAYDFGGSLSFRMIFNSAAFTEGCRAGSSRNHFHHPADQNRPTDPNIQKLARQPTFAIIAIASGGASAPPNRVAIKMMLWARPRSSAGNHCEKLRDVLGNAPASPEPKRNRNPSKERKFHANPVAIVNADHQRTMRVRTLRGPMVSPSHPLGISKIAYANVNALNTHPI